VLAPRRDGSRALAESRHPGLDDLNQVAAVPVPAPSALAVVVA
jgi:hypothetical protein